MASFFNILILKANRSIRLFLFVPILLFTHPAFSQHDGDINLQIAYTQFLNLQFDSCKQSIKYIPTDPLAFYLEALLAATTIFIEDDYDLYKAQKFRENELLEKLDELNFSEPYTHFLRSEIKLQWAILKLKNGDEFAAFWNLKQAYNIAVDNVNKNPDFLPSYKTLGLLHVLYGIFPEKYSWILSIFGIEGDVSTGLSELDLVYKNKHFLSLECGITMALLQAYLLVDPPKGAELMGNIHGKMKLLLTDYTYVLILMKNAQSGRAFDIIAESEYLYPQPTMLAQLDYLKGEILLQQGLLDEAIQSYHIFLSRHTGQDLIKDTYYKIGICYLIKDQREQAEVFFAKSRQNGWAKNEADKNAESELLATRTSTKELYQMRYATDGGFYKKAFKIHDKIDTIILNAHDKCEYYYRSARLYHKTDDTENAILNYYKTIDYQQDENWYYAPNSALQLGMIYISEHNIEEATRYLNLVNEYRGYPYQNSIRQKAKTVLKKLE